MAAVTGRRPDGHLGELLSAYLDGELSAADLGLVVEHLDGCEACIAEFRALQEARTALRLLPSLELPAGCVPEAHAGERLSAYLDGELDTIESRAVLAHLGRCSGCRDELHELDAARIAVRSLPTLEPPTAPVVLGATAGSRRSRVAAGWAAGVAAALAITVGVTSSVRSSETVDLDSIATRHAARVSVDAGVTVVPAVAPVGGGR